MFVPAIQDRGIQPVCDGKPALIFASHLGNWELPALAAAHTGWMPRSCIAGRTSLRRPHHPLYARREDGHADSRPAATHR